MTSVMEHYKKLHELSGEILDKTVNTQGSLEALRKCHCYLEDFTAFFKVVVGRREASVLERGLIEYQFGLIAVTVGRYRHAFASLRLSLEYFLATVDFSANERLLRLWENGRQDIVWQRFVDKEIGVLSKSFVGAFWEDMKEHVPRYQALAEKVYRECSEYVHGNCLASSKLPSVLAFSTDAVLEWEAKARVVHLVALFALTVRYLPDLSEDAHKRIEPVITDHLGHLAEVREALGGPVES